MIALAAAALAAWGLKRHYAAAAPDDLLWILSPTAWLVSSLTGAAFVFQAGEGYLSREHLFLIEKSCAGINFMIAAFGMLVWMLLHRARSAITAAQMLAVSLLAGYAAAVVVNGVRITIAMRLAVHPAALSTFSASDVHRVEGVVVYFGGLALLYLGSDLVFQHQVPHRALRRAAVPLASYYAVTLGLPLANGAAGSNSAFARHALVVLIVPPIVILFGRAVQAHLDRWMTQNVCPPIVSDPVLSGPVLTATEKFTAPLPVPAPRSVITSQPPTLEAATVQLQVERVATPTAP